MYTDGTEKLNHRELQNRLGVSFPRSKPPEGWEMATHPDTTVAELLRRQKATIRINAEFAYVQAITDAQARVWNGGFDSALKIKSAADMAEFAGLTSITLYDIDNAEHVVTLVEAKGVAATIGGVFQQKLAAKQAAMRALAAIDLTAPDAKEQIYAINYSQP